MAKKMTVEEIAVPATKPEVLSPEPEVNLLNLSKEDLIAMITELKAKPARAARTTNENTLSFYLKGLLMEGDDNGVCTRTNDEIFRLVCEKFPEWPNEGRKWYVSWYRFDLKRKGVANIPTANKPVKPKSETKAKAPRKTAAEKDASIDAFINSTVKTVIVEPGMPTPTVSKTRRNPLLTRAPKGKGKK